MISNFSYLGDVLDDKGGAEAALNARIKKGWYAFRQLTPLLLCRGVSLRVECMMLVLGVLCYMVVRLGR